MLRPIKSEDIPKLKELLIEHFGDEFQFHEFFDHAISTFIYTEQGKIISAGSVRSILEALTITDKSATAKERYRAFSTILSASGSVCNRHGYRELHAFIQDPHWYRILQKVGFKPTVGKALVIRNDNG